MYYPIPKCIPSCLREQDVPEIVEVNRLNDYYVKYLLGSEIHKDLTIHFLNDVLNRNGNQAIVDLTFSNTEYSPQLPDGKLNTLDIRCIIDDGSQVNVEVQVRRKAFIIERFLYYWAMVYGEQLQKSENYDQLRPAISINLLNFNCLPDNHWHNTYHLRNDESHTMLTDHCEIHYLELKKFTFRALLQMKRAEKWALYFSGNRGAEWRDLIMSDRTMKKVDQAEAEFTKDKERRWQYLMQERAIRDYNTDIKYAKQEAAQQAAEQATANTTAMIIVNMLKANSPYAYISQMTEYPIDKIKEIAKEHHLL